MRTFSALAASILLSTQAWSDPNSDNEYSNRDAIAASAISGEGQRCLRTRAYRSVRVVNNRYVLLFKGNRGWLNVLPRRCGVLDVGDSLRFDATVSRSCAGGRVGVIDRNSGLGEGACTLGQFYPLTKAATSELVELTDSD